MSEECTHDCSTCGAACPSKSAPESLYEAPNPLSNVKHVIGIVSGKGGVGKSLVTSMMAVNFAREGYKVGILDADITGPSIPKIFGVKADVEGDEHGLIPPRTKTGIEVMSVNLLLDDEKKPVVWRGPVIAGTVKQFWTDVIWRDIDFLFVDCPPGTGDVPLTVFQSIPLSGIIIVSSPQELVSMIVAKAVNMAKMMNIPVLGIVENMSYFKCPDCGTEYKIFGESHIEEVTSDMGLDLLARVPMDPKLAALCDRGMLELMENNYFDGVTEKVLRGILNK
ncbi:MAG: Mrp/NBP35 family ATP-binding protein [Clostridia bacterium]|nr:Mrp/NBP35 family ATP-binding protein [Clostridia bacterium]